MEDTIRNTSLLKKCFCVVSSSTWDWAIALAQLGIKRVVCFAIGPRAKSAFEAAVTAVPGLSITLQLITSGVSFPPGDVHCAHLGTEDDVRAHSAFVQSWQQVDTCFISMPTRNGKLSRVARRQFFGVLHRKVTSAALGHTRYGGLTSGGVDMHWWSTSDMSGLKENLSGGLPTRPLDRFLEPAAKLFEWRKSHGNLNKRVWDPTLGKPFPWPFCHANPWVRTKSVFFKDWLIERPMTVKERGQLLDIRQDWALSLVTLVWSWNNNAPVPLRLLAEFVLKSSCWLVPDAETMEVPLPIVDWGRNRPHITELASPAIPDDPLVNTLQHLEFFGWVWEPEDAANVTTAARADDAEVDTSLWAVGGESGQMEQARNQLRHFFLGLWVRRLYLEAISWLHSRSNRNDHGRDVGAARDALLRAGRSSWFGWDDGSALFPWRWPDCWSMEARDGSRAYHLHKPLPKRRARVVDMDPDVRDLIDDKLRKLIRRRYIEPSNDVTVATPVFGVKKPGDIRAVWSGTENGVNPSIFAPSFFLPSIGTLCRRLHSGCYQGDFDIGEMFHNFPLHPTERHLHGVNIPKNLQDELNIPWMFRCCRLPFGFCGSPVFAVRMTLRGVELAKGDPKEADNPFGWETILINLPGQDDYDPGLPSIIRLMKDGTLAADVIMFVDDGRVYAGTEITCHRAMRRITSRLQYRGIQDAARKRRPISQRPGAWSGGCVHTDQGMARKFVSQIKWDRARTELSRLREETQSGGGIHAKSLRSTAGFFVHMAATYEFCSPYLKGFFLTLYSWLPGRNSATGWKTRLPSAEEDTQMDELVEAIAESKENDEDYGAHAVTHRDLDGLPEYVMPVDRWESDLSALESFFSKDTPVMVLLRPVQSKGGALSVAYGFGDASGEGFGSSFLQGSQILVRHGFWCTEVSEQSSNYRELRNLVESIEREAVKGNLTGREVFMFTDNAVSEGVYYRGTSTEPTLFDLLLRLRQSTIQGNFILKIVHVAGTRMIAQGTDGLSRGERQVGALSDPEQNCVPLHLDPITRQPTLVSWIEQWMDEPFRIATPEDWFWNAHNAGCYDPSETLPPWIWTLPPAAAIHALEEFGIARAKRHDSLRGAIMVPRLMKPEWFRRFVRMVDVYFVIQPGSSIWPKHMHEPLIVGLFLPLLRCEPWDWKRCRFMVDLGRTLSGMHQENEPGAWDILRKFWKASSTCNNLPQHVVCKLLSGPSWKAFLRLSRNR